MLSEPVLSAPELELLLAELAALVLSELLELEVVPVEWGVTNNWPASFSQVKLTHWAPNEAHLQFTLLGVLLGVHQPVPASAGTQIELPKSHILEPHSVPPSVQSLSFIHDCWARAGEVQSPRPATSAAAERANALSFTGCLLCPGA